MHNLKENEVGFASIFVLLVVARLFFVGQEERITSPPFSFLLPSPFFFFPFGICSSLFVRSRGILLHMESSACSSLRLPTLVLLFVHGKQTLTKIFPLAKGRTHTHAHTRTHTHTHHTRKSKGSEGSQIQHEKTKTKNSFLVFAACVCRCLPPFPNQPHQPLLRGQGTHTHIHSKYTFS